MLISRLTIMREKILKLPNKNDNDSFKGSRNMVKLSINFFKYLSNKIIINN
jgi:Txe/YoeB family toxin of Txe-Axe toxin-antitoxin module